MMPIRAASLLLLLLVLGVTGCDQASKGWAERDLRGEPPTSLVAGRVELAYTRNPGVAFSVLGAAGNLLDRFTRGYVVDFIHVRGWPVFNVADVAIGAGVALLLLDALRRRPTDATT